MHAVGSPLSKSENSHGRANKYSLNRFLSALKSIIIRISKSLPLSLATPTKMFVLAKDFIGAPVFISHFNDLEESNSNIPECLYFSIDKIIRRILGFTILDIRSSHFIDYVQPRRGSSVEERRDMPTNDT